MPSDVEAYSRLAGVYDEIVVDPCFDRWASFLHELWASEGLPVDSVLDVCCGTGLLAAELIGRGYRVTGLDASEAMLARARRLLGPAVPLLHQSLPDIRVEEPFDAVVSTFDGLNYLTPSDFAASLTRLASLIRPSGWLVFDLHTDAMMTFSQAHPLLNGNDHGWTFIITNDVDLELRTCRTRIEATHDVDGDTFSETHQQYFHSDSDVSRALAAAGFVNIAVVAEYSHEPVDSTTLRSTWVARLPTTPGAIKPPLDGQGGSARSERVGN